MLVLVTWCRKEVSLSSLYNLGVTKDDIDGALADKGVAILPPMDAMESFRLLFGMGYRAKCCVLDPWYNKGTGGVREDYEGFILRLLSLAGAMSDHVYLWGFPEVVARFVPAIPKPLALRCWLTWYYKNCAGRIRGWRSSQQACLHLATADAVMHVENFLSEERKRRLAEGKALFMNGPSSVIEESLLCGFVGKKEQTGHPAQKPVGVIRKLVLMATAPGELVVDLMAGSGTTGVACLDVGRPCVLCDLSEEYTAVMEKRLGVGRLVG